MAEITVCLLSKIMEQSNYHCWCLGLFILLISALELSITAMKQNKISKHQNVSSLLDNLLEGYDNNLRPDFGGPPIIVEIDINVRSMGPVSEIDMTYSMDCYFRQSWVDRRLAFTGNMPTMTLSISMLEKIWKPDTYFYNGKLSYVHVITVPNKFVRLNQDGRVLYSQRLTIKASCPMNLENFPMDSQTCPLQVGSFGYSRENVIYRWNDDRQVVIASDMKMSQFDLMDTPSGNRTHLLSNGEFSTLVVSFHLQRHMGYFVIQVYAPCILLVVLSWVAFWINREATADRVALGVTTVLTMTFLGLESRSDLPKVTYSTALDFFVAISFIFVFATIIQFALVHYFTKIGSGEVFLELEPSSEENEVDTEDEIESTVFTTERAPSQGAEHNPAKPKPFTNFVSGHHHHVTGSGSNGAPGGHSIPYNGRRQSTVRRKQRLRRLPRDVQINSVSKIDQVSRVLFPLTFLAINIVYWCLYLTRTRPTDNT